MTNSIQTQTQVITAGMAQIRQVTDMVEAAGYQVPEFFEELVSIQDVQALSIEGLASYLVAVDANGFLGNSFDSQIITSEHAEEVAAQVLSEGGLPALGNLMSDLEGYCSEYVIYNDLAHFETLTWGYCLDRFEEVVDLVVSDYLADLKADYLGDSVQAIIEEVARLAGFEEEVSVDFNHDSLCVDLLNSDNEYVGYILVSIDDHSPGSLSEWLALEADMTTFKVYKDETETIFHAPTMDDAEEILDSVL